MVTAQRRKRHPLFSPSRHQIPDPLQPVVQHPRIIQQSRRHLTQQQIVGGNHVLQGCAQQVGGIGGLVDEFLVFIGVHVSKTSYLRGPDHPAP